MEKEKIKLIAFKNTSAETLVKEMDFPKTYLPSDLIKDSEIIKKEIAKSQVVICFGQKPLIKNKICLELIAKNQDKVINTNFEIEFLKKQLELNSIPYSESYNPGTSYCNLVYWNGLNFIKEKNLNCKFLLVHIPFEKNIDCISALQTKLNVVLKNL